MKASYEELYKIIGQINFTLSRLTYIMSQHLYDIGIEAEFHSFFANLKTKEKFEKLPNAYEKLPVDSVLRVELEDWIKEITDLIEKRNTLTHSLILFSIDDPDIIKTFNYRFKESRITKDTKSFSFQELRELNNDFIKIHNKGCGIMERIEQVYPALNVFVSDRNYDYVSEIEEWLRKEFKDLNTGFYDKMDSIFSSIMSGKAFIARLESEIIGFATFWTSEKIITIDFLEIKPAFRRKGFGDVFARRIVNHFKKQRCLVIKLKSIDEDSTAFWEKLDYINISKLPFRNPGFTHYLPISCAKINALPNKQKVSIEIWDFNTSRYRSHGAVFKVNVINSGSVVILPVEGDWDLKVLVDENETHNILIKRLENSYPKFLFGDFLVITDVSKLLSYIEKIT